MTDHTAMPKAITRYDSISHGGELLAGPGAVPERFNWRTMHGATLAAQFKAALKKLEGLLYVAFGGQPDYAGGQQWYTREHPRCRWRPEQWWEQPSDNPPPDAFWNYLEYAALGDLRAGGAPSAPLRSRSGDPAVQFRYAGHSVYFPQGSVERYVGAPGTTGHAVHDPASTFKQFAAWPDSEDVVVRYTVPPGKTATAVDLVTSVGTIAMAEVSAGVWEATIEAQNQGTWVDWYLAGQFTDAPGVTRHDPYAGETGGVENAPTMAGAVGDPEHDRPSGVAYTFVFYSHYNPYGSGFPELLDENEPHTPGNWLRRGTDAHRFDSSENIQPELVNMCRFILEAFGKVFQHNPGARGDSSLCCFDIPINWRWSGSNVPNLYRSGGKAGTDPLHDNPAQSDAGDENARKTWRGIEMAWRDAANIPGLFPDNVDYGDTESWLAYEDRLYLEPDPLNPPVEAIIRDYADRGLKSGDVIDPVHLVEIIDAVDYLISNGLWKTVLIYRTKASPGSMWGVTCGDWWSYAEIGGDVFDEHTVYPGCHRCCASCVGWNAGTPGSMSCVEHSKPTWAECQGQNSTCQMAQIQVFDDCGSINGESYCVRGHRMTCDFDSWVTNDATCPFDFSDYRELGARVLDQWVKQCYQNNDPPDLTNQLHRWRFGLSYFLCGPVQADNGPAGDALHGNGITKPRFDALGNFSATGPSMGNRYGGIHACQSLAPTETTAVGFQTVSKVEDDGVAPHWYDAAPNCCGGGDPRTYLSVPGLGIYNFTGDALLSTYGGDHPPCTPDTASQHVISRSGEVGAANWPACRGQSVFVSVDLNLDGEGLPQLYDYDLGIADPYDECPCKTWTGPSVCE